MGPTVPGLTALGRPERAWEARLALRGLLGTRMGASMPGAMSSSGKGPDHLALTCSESSGPAVRWGQPVPTWGLPAPVL